MDAEKQSKIDQFKNLTGVDDSRAQFYLESAAWQLEVAIESFYDEAGDDDDVQVIPPQPPAAAPVTDDAASAPPRHSSRNTRVTTFSSFQRDNEREPNDEEGQEFYAGGSETSGQAIVGPPRKKQGADDLIQNMFKAAKEHGAEEVGMDEAMSGRRPVARTFKGSGYRLGENNDDTQTIPGESTEEPEEIDVTITFWNNGFSVDDGPLRNFDDKNNKPFLESISKGQIPAELVQRAKGGEVNVNMMDKRGEEYVKPKTTMKAFTGEGRMLGSPCPSVLPSPNNLSSPNSKQKNTDSAQNEVSVDASQPTTQIQIRLSDGSRLVAKFNHSHTVGDIRRYICTARPEFAPTNFVLMTTYPRKEYSDVSIKISDANLLNAVIVQQMR